MQAAFKLAQRAGRHEADDEELELAQSRASLDDEARRLLPAPLAPAITSISTTDLADPPLSPGPMAHYTSLLSLTTSRISSVGTALGFFSGVSVLALLIVPVTLMGGTTSSLRVAVGVSAIWWAVFTIPAWRGLPGGDPSDKLAMERGMGWANGWKRVGSMIKPSEMRSLPNLFTFLLAWIFLSDGTFLQSTLHHITQRLPAPASAETSQVSTPRRTRPSSMRPRRSAWARQRLSSSASSSSSPLSSRRFWHRAYSADWAYRTNVSCSGWSCWQRSSPCTRVSASYSLLAVCVQKAKCTWRQLGSVWYVTLMLVWTLELKPMTQLYGPFNSYSRAVYAELIPPVSHAHETCKARSSLALKADPTGPRVIILLAVRIDGQVGLLRRSRRRRPHLRHDGKHPKRLHLLTRDAGCTRSGPLARQGQTGEGRSDHLVDKPTTEYDHSRFANLRSAGSSVCMSFVTRCAMLRYNRVSILPSKIRSSLDQSQFFRAVLRVHVLVPIPYTDMSAERLRLQELQSLPHQLFDV